MELKKKRLYERPSMKVVELQHQTMLLAGSDTKPLDAGRPDYDSEEW